MSAFADIPAFTWGNRPAAGSVRAGTLIRISDVGVPGIYMISDGVSTWTPVGAQMLGRSSVAVPLTGTTSETPLATITVPAAAMGLNGGVEVRTVWTTINNANTKTPRVRFGGVAGTVYASPGLTTTVSYSEIRRIRNRGAANSQVGSFAAASTSGFGSSTAVNPTSALDTTASADIVISGQLGVGTDTLTLESYEVWLLP